MTRMVDLISKGCQQVFLHTSTPISEKTVYGGQWLLALRGNKVIVEFTSC